MQINIQISYKLQDMLNQVNSTNRHPVLWDDEVSQRDNSVWSDFDPQKTPLIKG